MNIRLVSRVFLASLFISASLVGCNEGLDASSQRGAITANGVMFFDEFDGTGLDPNWTATRGAFTANGGALVENSGQRYIDAQLFWDGGITESPDQVAKIQVIQKASHSWGFMFRTGGTHHYEVHLPVGSTRWRWELNDPDFVERVDDCPSDAKVGDGDWLAATTVGSGTDVVVSVWRWDSDPDLGGLPNPEAWGAPDCVMTADPSVTSDELGLGVRAYTGNSTAPGRADHWAAGDIPSGECGNGIQEPGEACDDGGETAACNANCTVADCGDGIFNPLAEQCELDAHCNVDEACNASCLCEVPPPPPVCGNSVLEAGEDCDDGGETVACDANCTFAECDDGVFNPVAEQCEQNSDCAGGELCLGCTCVVSNGQLFSDDFLGGALDSRWTAQTGSFSVSGGLLVEDSGARFLNARLDWSVPTDTPSQFGKLKIQVANTHTWGFQSRLNDSTGHHYEVHLPIGSSEWRWELYNPGFVERVSQCAGDAAVGNGDWIGFTIDGSGPNTTVEVWRWDFDPDGGGVTDPAGNWGAPDCVMQELPSVNVAGGLGLGIRSYTGSSKKSASIDYWVGGDLVGGECGNGVVEPGEACDDGLETAACNANCTLAACGDGTFNQLAEECEFDVNCNAGDICNASCACETPPPPPICGNGVPELGEACDEGGQTATCDADCTLPVCGDGELNPGAGEQCEADADCGAGELCLSCTCGVSNGQVFSDNFDAPVLDPAWTTLNGSFSVGGGRLVEEGGARFSNTQLLWDGGLADTADQYAKLELVDLGVRSWGFIQRYGDGSGHHYEIHLSAGSSEWRWELNDPDFVERVGSCAGDTPPSSGDWLGVAVEGAGANTKVSVWRWDSDPDSGTPNPLANWGAPDCQMKVQPSVDVAGRSMGVRSYTGNSWSSSSIDNWVGGDLLESIPDLPEVGTWEITRILSSSGIGTPNSMLDPDGIAVDSADNVYVAACGLGPVSEGVFRITPGGAITQVLDTTGDGVSPASCPVGVAVDSADNVYVATYLSDNVFEISASGVITEVLNATGGGVASLGGPIGVAVDADDTLFVTGHLSNNVFAVTDTGGVQVILDASGGGTGTPLAQPFGVATDGAGNVFVAGFGSTSNSVFRVAPDNSTSIVLGPAGDGAGGPLQAPHALAVDPAGNLYITGNASDNVFKVTPGGVVTVIADLNGDGLGNRMDNPTNIAVDDAGNVYVAAFFSDNAFQIPVGGTPIEIIDATGDGTTAYGGASDFALALDSLGNVYVAGIEGDAAFRITPP